MKPQPGQSAFEKEMDLRRWFNLGRAYHDRIPIIPDRVCMATTVRGEHCGGFASYHDGEGHRFCVVHRTKDCVKC